ncbi:MAG: DinB family protein [Crocinitomicaceae bacterium]|nr:DinB family protein [Crocinitomicaceae bacterium]
MIPQMEHGGISLFINNMSKLEAGLNVYAKGKWTIPQIIEHLTDAERIFQYRALRYARQDKTELPGFDEDMYAAISKANDRSVKDLLNDYQIVRNSTISLYKTFDKDQFFFTGKANGQETSVIALGFMMIGHAVHHYKVIEERYF